MKQKLGLYVLPIAAFISVAFGVCQAQSVLTKHVRKATQDGTARLIGQLSPTQTMNLVITLPLRNQDQLNQLLQDLYDPTSPSYRQFLTVEQFTAQFGPTQQDYDAVINFAQEKNLTVLGTSPNRLIVQVSGSAANVEAAFHVNLNVYQHPTENRTFYAPDREPTTDLTSSLWHITGIDNFSLPHPAGLSKNPDNLRCPVQRHYRLRPVGLVPGQRHEGGLLRRIVDRQRPVRWSARVSTAPILPTSPPISQTSIRPTTCPFRSSPLTEPAPVAFTQAATTSSKPST